MGIARVREYGLDVIALVGALRYTSHRSVPEIHEALCDRGISIAERTVTHLLREAQQMLDVPIRGVISDGQHSIRKAVQLVLPEVPHQLCHFHYLREAAKPVYEADRYAQFGTEKAHSRSAPD